MRLLMAFGSWAVNVILTVALVVLLLVGIAGKTDGTRAAVNLGHNFLYSVGVTLGIAQNGGDDLQEGRDTAASQENTSEADSR